MWKIQKAAAKEMERHVREEKVEILKKVWAI